MAVIEGGTNASLVEVGVAASVPLHIAAKPVPYGALGHYRVARRFVPAGTTLAGNLWCFRNISANLALIERIKLTIVQVAAPTAAIEDLFNIKVARAYTVSDVTASVAITPAAAMQKLRTSMGNSGIELREANAAAGASGGTRTLDTDAFASGSQWVSAAIPGAPLTTVLDYYPNPASGEYPLALANNEGFIIANGNAFGAVSGIILQLELVWAEVTAF